MNLITHTIIKVCEMELIKYSAIEFHVPKRNSINFNYLMMISMNVIQVFVEYERDGLERQNHGNANLT